MKITEERLSVLNFQADNKGVHPTTAARLKKEHKWDNMQHAVTVHVTSTELRALLDAYMKENS